MKKIIFVVLSVVIMLLAAVPAFAETETDYSINYAWWNTDGGKVVAEWNKPKSSTKYRLTIYVEPVGGAIRQTATKTLSSTKLDFTSSIQYPGSYWFEVYPVKGGEAETVCSDVLVVDVDMLKKIILNEYKEEDAKAAAAAYKWAKQPNGNWFLMKNGVPVSDAWEKVDGYWYLFDASGNMLKGWQQKDGKFYYLNVNAGVGGYPEGACMMNTTTPDGYKVDSNGARIK